MQIADGRKSVQGIRAAEAVKHKKLRDSSSPVRTGEARAVSNMERLEPASHPTAPAVVAGPAGEPAIEGAASAKTSSSDRLLDAWGASSEEERTAFLRAIGEDIDAYQQGTLRRAHYEGKEEALEDIRKRYEKRRTEDLNDVHEQSQLKQKIEYWEGEIRWIDLVIKKLRAQNEPNFSDTIENVEYEDVAALHSCIIQEEHWKRLDQLPSSSQAKANTIGKRLRERDWAETELDLSSETDCNEPSGTIVGSATNNPVDEEPSRAVTRGRTSTSTVLKSTPGRFRTSSIGPGKR